MKDIFDNAKFHEGHWIVRGDTIAVKSIKFF